MPSARTKVVLGLLLAALLVAAAVFFLAPRRFDGPVNVLKLDLARPDALIRTRSLSRLPADLLRVPLVRDVLTEDFVDYYEHHEGRLALAGTVRRIAYEHSLSLPERLVESVFDEPAEVALWRGGDGSLRHFAVAMTRNGLARALQAALPILPGDAQLQSAGTLEGTRAPVLVLHYGHRDRLLLVARGDRVVALSDPGMLLAPAAPPEPGAAPAAEPADPLQDPRAAETLRRLLDADDQSVSPFAGHFELAAAGGVVHELVLASSAFTFGYDAFAPGVAALSFAFDDRGGWRTAALLDGARLPAGGLDGAALWSALPHGASLCALAPADWSRLAPLAGSLGVEAAAARELAGAFTGPGAVCWYGESRLYTPLFAAGFAVAPDEARGAQLAALFAAAVGKGAPEQRSPVEAVALPDGARLWRRSVETPFGAAGGEDSPALAPSLALQGRTVFFSPDAALVDKALDVAAKVYPAQGDSLPDAGRTLAIVDPAPLAALARKEVFAALPRDEEAVLRNAAEAHLLPRLEVLARYPAFRLVHAEPPAGGGKAWRALEWIAVEAR